jgi:hypothetical protein
MPPATAIGIRWEPDSVSFQFKMVSNELTLIIVACLIAGTTLRE